MPATLVALNSAEFDAIVFGGSSMTNVRLRYHHRRLGLTQQSNVILATLAGRACGEYCDQRGHTTGECEPGWDADDGGANGVFLQPEAEAPDHGAGSGERDISGPGPEPTDPATLVALDKTEITTEVSGGTAGHDSIGDHDHGGHSDPHLGIGEPEGFETNSWDFCDLQRPRPGGEYRVPHQYTAGECEPRWDADGARICSHREHEQ